MNKRELRKRETLKKFGNCNPSSTQKLRVILLQGVVLQKLTEILTYTRLPEHEASIPQIFSQILFALRTLNSDTKELAHLFLETIKVCCMTQLCLHVISARYIVHAMMLSRLNGCNSYFSVKKKRKEIINSNVIQDLES